jgi:hypothetical protein
MKWRAAGALLAMVAGSVLALPPADAVAVQTCGVSHIWTLCLTVPDGALSGEVPISVSVSGKDRDKLEKLIFTYRPNGGSLVEVIRDFERPYGFLWPTDKELDGSGVLAVQSESTSNDVGEKVRLTVTLANGNLGSIPRNLADWAERFHPEMPPAGDPVIAAVGRGAMGKRVNDQVIDSILARAPSLFLYLGEVYEFGTYASMRNWYGLADVDDPSGEGTAWGRMASYTAPTAGNHDTLEGTDPWLDYWHQRPLYTSFDFGGVHYIDLDSNCGQVGGCGSTSKQYAYFKADLQANTLPCVVAYWNKTILSLDAHREGSSMAELWSLIAKNGGDVVLNAGGHGMEEWKPLSPALQAGRWNSHMVELNVSSGTDRWERVYQPDDRNAWEAYPQLGALSMTADGGAIGPATGLTWTFHDTAGTTLRQNSVGC